MCQKALDDFKQKINEQNADINSLIDEALTTCNNLKDSNYKCLLLGNITDVVNESQKNIPPKTITNLINECTNISDCKNGNKGTYLNNIVNLLLKHPEFQTKKTIDTLLNIYNDLTNCNVNIKGKCLVNIVSLADKLPENELSYTTIYILLKEYKNLETCDDTTKGKCLVNIAKLFLHHPKLQTKNTTPILLKSYYNLKGCNENTKVECLINIGIAATSPKNSTVLASQTKTEIANSLYKIYKQCDNNNEELKSKLHDTIEKLVPNFIKTKKTEEDNAILSTLEGIDEWIKNRSNEIEQTEF